MKYITKFLLNKYNKYKQKYYGLLMTRATWWTNRPKIGATWNVLINAIALFATSIEMLPASYVASNFN